MLHLQTELGDVEKKGRTFLLDVLSPLLSLAVDSSVSSFTDSSGSNISRQAARTTLSRVSLYMGYASGPDMLRNNLDYIVDAVCLYLQHLQRTTKHAMDIRHQRFSSSALHPGSSMVAAYTHPPPPPPSVDTNTTVGFVAVYDARVVTVVGSVLETILSESGDQVEQGGLGGPAGAPQQTIDMLLRDMVAETLSTIDLLSALASSGGSQGGMGVGMGVDSSSRLSIRVAPLLDLMHSLVRTAVPPLPDIPESFLTPTDRRSLRQPGTSSSSQKQQQPQEQKSQEHAARGQHKGLFSTPYFFSEPSAIPAATTKHSTSLEAHTETSDAPVSALTNSSLKSVDTKSSYPTALDSLIQSLTSFRQQWQTTQQNMLAQSIRCKDENDNDNDDLEFPFNYDTDANKGGHGDGLPEEKDEEETDPPELDLIVKVLEKCHYFMACAELSAQVSVVNVMMSGFSRLAKNKKLCLPALHKAWPAIMTRIKELRALYVSYHQHHHSRGDSDAMTAFTSANAASDAAFSIQKLFLLPHLLQLVSLLAFLCGDFVSMKFKEDLWPELMIILHVCSQEVLMSLPQVGSGSFPSSLPSSSSAAIPLNKDRNSPTKREKLGDVMFSATPTISLPPSVALDLLSPSSPPSASAPKATSSRETSSSSRFSLLEKLKSSLLNCLSVLASMTVHDISAGPITGSCLDQGDMDSEDGSRGNTTIANPLRPIAPLCIWLLLPLLASSPFSASHPSSPKECSGEPTGTGEKWSPSQTPSQSQQIVETMRHISRLDIPFATGLFEVILAVSGRVPPPKPLSFSEPTEGVETMVSPLLLLLSEARAHPLRTWEGLRAHPVIADSYAVLNTHITAQAQAHGNTCRRAAKWSSFSSAPVLQRLVASASAAENKSAGSGAGLENSALARFSEEICLAIVGSNAV